MLSKAQHVVAIHSVKHPLRSFKLLSDITGLDAQNPKEALAELLTIEHDAIEELHRLDQAGKLNRRRLDVGTSSLGLAVVVVVVWRAIRVVAAKHRALSRKLRGVSVCKGFLSWADTCS